MERKFFENIDFERVNLLLEGFNRSTGFVTAILDLQGNVLSKSGWRQICTEFHRKNPLSAESCNTSDTVLANNMNADEKYHFYQCKNGLVDVAVPIVIKGEHVANLFSGQFFFEAPDVEYFKKQANEYGFDQNAYLKALGDVPIVSEAEVKTNMDFLLTITQMIADMTIEKLELIELNETVLKSKEELRNSQEMLQQSMEDLLGSQEIAHVGTWRLDLATDQVVWSEELYKMYGFDPKLPPPPYSEHMKLFTPESWELLSTSLELTRNTGVPYELELEMVISSGVNGWMWVRGEATKDSEGNIVSLWGAAQDITERKKTEQQLKKEEEQLMIQNNLFTSLLEVLPVGVFMVEADSGKPLVSNESAKELTGRGILPDATKDNLNEVYKAYKYGTHEHYPTNEMPIVRGMYGESSHVDDLIVQKPDGSERRLEVFGIPIPDANGKTWASLVTFTDITERKQIEMKLRESEERFQMLFNQAPLGYQSLDIDGNFLEINQKWLDLFGYQKKDVVGKWFGDFLAPEYREAFKKRFPIFKAQGYIHSEFEMLAKSGEKMFIAFDGRIGYAEDGEFKQTHCILKDITVEKELSRELAKSRELMQATLVSVGDGVISCDVKGNVQFMNPVAEKLTGWSQQEAQGQIIEEIFNIYNEDTGDKSDSITRLVLESGSIVELANHTVLLSKHGDKKPIEDTAAPIILDNGEIVGVVIVFSDCSEKRTRMEEIEFLSYHDYLTGVYNRRFFEEELKRYDVSRNFPISIVMGDVNGLKLVNDSFGHATGDEILKKASELIVKCCRADDIVARLGGDEFIVLLPKAGEEDASGLIKRVQDEMNEEKISGIPLSVSFGQATKTQEGESLAEILKDAEDHMYRHKLYESTGARSKTVTLIINTLYAKNHREMLHSQRVGALSATIANYLGYESDDVNQMRTAGLMHDIGKIGIEDSILNKAEPLNEQEWEEIKKHSEIGYRILSSVPEFSEIANFVLEHQEKWDGTGYPRGLKQNEISQEARILAVADSFDAMTGERSYGRVLSEAEAIQELLRCAGSQFDPEIVSVFISNLNATGVTN